MTCCSATENQNRFGCWGWGAEQLKHMVSALNGMWDAGRILRRL